MKVSLYIYTCMEYIWEFHENRDINWQLKAWWVFFLVERILCICCRQICVRRRPRELGHRVLIIHILSVFMQHVLGHEHRFALRQNSSIWNISLGDSLLVEIYTILKFITHHWTLLLKASFPSNQFSPAFRLQRWVKALHVEIQGDRRNFVKYSCENLEHSTLLIFLLYDCEDNMVHLKLVRVNEWGSSERGESVHPEVNYMVRMMHPIVSAAKYCQRGWVWHFEGRCSNINRICPWCSNPCEIGLPHVKINWRPDQNYTKIARNNCATKPWKNIYKIST